MEILAGHESGDSKMQVFLDGEATGSELSLFLDRKIVFGLMCEVLFAERNNRDFPVVNFRFFDLSTEEEIVVEDAEDVFVDMREYMKMRAEFYRKFNSQISL
jgi:hypothetical protein